MIHGTLTNQIVLRDKTHLACSKDELRPAMLGLYIKNRFCFATDSFILAVGRIEEQFTKVPSFEGIIPIEIVNQFWKSKSAYKRIDIWESQDEQGKKIILCSCDDLVKPLIDEKFPPIIDLLYRELTHYKMNEADTLSITLNPEYFNRLASAQGQAKNPVNLIINKKRNSSFLYCQSSISNDSNFGFFVLNRDSFIDMNADFWIKELRNLADPEEVIKWNKTLDNENTAYLERKFKEEEMTLKRLEYLEQYLFDNFRDEFDGIIEKMDNHFKSREVIESFKEVHKFEHEQQPSEAL
jgi:hypothetical protein